MAGSYRRLSEAERVGIMVMLREGLGMRAIGRRLGRHASTISREIARQRQDLSYEAWRAGCRADVLRFRRRNPRKLVLGRVLFRFVAQ